MTKNALPLDLTDVTMLCQFRLNRDAPVALQFTTDSGITITDAVNGVFQIDSCIIDVPVASYKYDIEMTFPNGSVYTYISGAMNVVTDISHG